MHNRVKPPKLLFVMFCLLQEGVFGNSDQAIACFFGGLKLGCGYSFEVPLYIIIVLDILGTLELLWHCLVDPYVERDQLDKMLERHNPSESAKVVGGYPPLRCLDLVSMLYICWYLM